MSNWENDISGLTLAWLLNVRQALNEDGPIAREHFRIRSDELADQLAAMTAEQVHRLVRMMGQAPMLRIDETAALQLAMSAVLSGGAGGDIDAARMAHAATPPRGA